MRKSEGKQNTEAGEEAERKMRFLEFSIAIPQRHLTSGLCKHGKNYGSREGGGGELDCLFSGDTYGIKNGTQQPFRRVNKFSRLKEKSSSMNPRPRTQTTSSSDHLISSWGQKKGTIRPENWIKESRA